jgi:hypothetical protein
MKKQTTEIIKIVVGILIGTAFVMGAMGFMLNMVLHPFIMILVLIVLFIVSGIMCGVFMGYKGVIIVIGSFIFGWFGFNAYYKHACGPNSADVKVMKPMAQKISEYIVENGIPESLKDIPDLPYGLEGCRRETTYGPSVKIYFTKDAEWKNNTETCNFKNITLRFSLFKSLKEKDAKWDGSLEMDSSHDTGLWMQIEEYDNKKMYLGKMSFSGKTSGICKSWRQ